MYYAALARSEADWIVGINATRALTTKYDAQLSLGRVQTPTIQLVNTRQQEINQFKPQQYFTLSLTVKGFDFQLESNQRYTNKETLEQMVNNLKNVDGKIKSVATKHKKSYPQSLYNLTDLQQDMYRRYKIGPKETLNTLQSLYERHKVVTYPRTDSNYLTTDMVDTMKERIQATMATTYKDQARPLMSKTFSSKCRYLIIKKYLITMQLFLQK